MKKIIVSKFGGTSMGDAKCMLRSAEVATSSHASLVVVSATSGTTNQLIELGQKAARGYWEGCELIISKIKDRHAHIANELKLSPEGTTKLYSQFEELESIARGMFLLKDCSAKSLDVLMSLGERMSSVLFCQALQNVYMHSVELIDARDVIKTDEQFGKARPSIEAINVLSEKFLKNCRTRDVIFVTQGFIGSTEDGATTTLGRGGSDYSAALFAEGLGADVLEIWTDVPGIATTDPRIYNQAQRIKELSFKEASELATFGAKVLHPATLLPAIRKNIPVFVGNSFDKEAGGTWIYKETKAAPLVRALALRKKQVLVTLTTPEMLQAFGFLYEIFKIFYNHKVSIDAITTSEISVSVTLDDSTLLNKALINDLEKVAEVQVEENLTLVSLIGNNINHTPGLSKQIFSAISDVNVRMICLGASKHNFCFLVSDAQGEESLRRLHKVFIDEIAGI